MASTQESIALVQKALAQIRAGRMVILTDDENRENEGDLVMAAEKVTPAAINFMAKYARGLICLSLTEERIKRLNLPLMVQENTSPFQTAFTVSIEAAKGVSTGISAADRAHTILTAVAPNARPADLSRPGHVFPLRARDGGVLVRTGQTEGSVDLARMAGLSPAGVICEVMRDDGTMARRPDLLRFAKKHKLPLLSVADLISYRLTRETLVRRAATHVVKDSVWGELTVHAYQSDVDGGVHLALVKGDVTKQKSVLTRVHRGNALADMLEHGHTKGSLHSALQRLRSENAGVLVYLQKPATPEQLLSLKPVKQAVLPLPEAEHRRLREFGVGAQILKDVGLTRLRLLTHQPRQIVGLESYGLKIVEYVKF
ncbi:MAG: 3,4-dihydroxy-2-butanone-4-phosphate synthase [Myxococcaceae bacterium]|nr:3,4-dihydroxy-2-butanone-4-phosphate synthase [Myxococcaceae bacterium]